MRPMEVYTEGALGLAVGQPEPKAPEGVAEPKLRCRANRLGEAQSIGTLAKGGRGGPQLNKGGFGAEPKGR